MIKVILFDVDGVVLKLEKMSTRYKRHLKDRYGISEEDLNPFFEHQFNKCLEGKSAFPSKHLLNWCSKKGFKSSSEIPYLSFKCLLYLVDIFSNFSTTPSTSKRITFIISLVYNSSLVAR